MISLAPLFNCAELERTAGRNTVVSEHLSIRLSCMTEIWSLMHWCCWLVKTEFRVSSVLCGMSKVKPRLSFNKLDKLIHTSELLQCAAYWFRSVFSVTFGKSCSSCSFKWYSKEWSYNCSLNIPSLARFQLDFKILLLTLEVLNEM